MIKRIQEGGKSGSQFDLHIDGDRGDASYTLVRSGKKWQPPYRNTKAIKVISDGNSVEAIIYKDHTGRKADIIELGFDEAFELAMTLLEYTKGDPHAPSPLYEVYDKVEVVQRGDKIVESFQFPEDLYKTTKTPKKKAKTKRQRRAENDRVYKNDKYGMGG